MRSGGHDPPLVWHARLGLQVVLEDYIHDGGSKFALISALNLATIGGGAFAIFSVAKLAFTGETSTGKV